MAKQPEAKPDSETDLIDQSAKRVGKAICINVIGALGRPSDLLRITAHQVTERGFRVNVVAGIDNSSCRIVHSFFVTADANGSVISSDPAIVKLY